MTFQAVLLTEGTSDGPLGVLLRNLCLDRGYDILVSALARNQFPAGGRSVAAMLEELNRRGDVFDLAFIHRDSDNQGLKARKREIEQAVAATTGNYPWVPVVPIRMTEAWLLLDEVGIRRVAGRPDSRDDLGLPSLQQVESIADPKAVLHAALLTASGTRGRKRDRFRRDLGLKCNLLLNRLDHRGPVTGLRAWQHLVAELEIALDQLGQASGPP